MMVLAVRILPKKTFLQKKSKERPAPDPRIADKIRKMYMSQQY